MANALITWQEVLLEVVGMALNKEQNMQVAPQICSVAGRLTTDFMLDEIARVFPYNTRVSDMARPFLKRKLILVNEGIAIVPDDYRNILSVSIAVNKDQTSGCNCEQDDDCIPYIDDHCTPIEIEQKRVASARKEKCYFQKVNILDIDQYDDATQSDLYPPSLKNPICMFVDRTTLKICPIEGISYVEIRYLKQPIKSNIGYKIMPDDTWQVDTASPYYLPLEWERNANPIFYKCMASLLGLHIRDGNFIQWNNELKKIGFF